MDDERLIDGTSIVWAAFCATLAAALVFVLSLTPASIGQLQAGNSAAEVAVARVSASLYALLARADAELIVAIYALGWVVLMLVMLELLRLRREL